MKLHSTVGALCAATLAFAFAGLTVAHAGSSPTPPTEEVGEEADEAADTSTNTGEDGDDEATEIPPERGPTELSIPIRLSGYFWVDTGYMSRKNARAGQYDQDVNYMQGRFILAAEYHQEFAGFYARARTEFIGFVNEFTKSQFEAHVLDAYVQLGQSWWDIQVGRFLAWEVYHRGQGIELYTAEEAGAFGGPALYWLQTVRGHKNEAGQAAIHLYPTDFLSFEVAAIYGQEQNQNNLGVRPVFDLRFGGFQLIAGYEYFQQRPQTTADKVSITTHGFASRLQYEVPQLLRVGANVGHNDVEYITIQGDLDGDRTLNTTSVGGFVDVDFWRSSLGLGYHYTLLKNREGEENTHHQAFVSYLVRLPIEGLSVKAVYGFALASIQDIDTRSEWDNSMHSVRLRIAYDFR